MISLLLLDLQVFPLKLGHVYLYLFKICLIYSVPKTTVTVRHFL